MRIDAVKTLASASRRAAGSTARSISARSSLCSAAALLLAGAPLQAQGPANALEWADSARKLIEVANLAGDTDQISAARALIDRALTRYPGDARLLHYRGYSLYREATVRMERGEQETRKYLEAAETALRASIKAAPIPESHALLSSVIGQQIGGNPIKVMTLGPRSNNAMDKAVALGPANPRVWLLRGIGALFAPGMFGGGRDKAEAYLKKSIELFAQDAPEVGAPAWGRDEAWLWLGRLYERDKRWNDARTAYEKALELEPRNNWVRLILLPELEKRRTSSR